MTSNDIMKHVRFPCSSRHFIAQLGHKNAKESADYTLKRIVQTLEQGWCLGQSPLYTFETDPRGQCVKKPVFPKAAVFTPEPHKLQAIPGCFEAYQGISKLELQVCRVNATGHIKIAPEMVQQFHGAGDLIKREAKALQDNQSKEVENLLLHMMTDQGAPQEGVEDPRPIEQAEDDPEGTKDSDGQKSLTFKSEEELKQSGVDIQADAKMHGMHSVKMPRDSTNRIWLVASQDSLTVRKGSIVGSYGAGKVCEVAVEAMTDGQGHN